jgi:hypothetical protein
MKYTERYRYLPITSVKSYRYYRYRLPVGQKKTTLNGIGIGTSKKNIPITADNYRLSLIGVPIVIGTYVPTSSIPIIHIQSLWFVVSG